MQRGCTPGDASRLSSQEPEVGTLGLPEPDRERVLVEWNRTEADFPREACVHHLFEAQVRRDPGAVAAICEEQSFTYADLNARANQLAHRLRREGVGPGVHVALCVERSLEMVAAVLGILKAGGAYVPIDPAYPRERIAFMLEDSGAPVLVTQSDLRCLTQGFEGTVVMVDPGDALLAGESREDLPGGAEAHDLAYIIYTSGSTGRPKGVLVEHRGVVNLVYHVQREPGATPQDVQVAVASLSFDMSVWDLFVPLCTGGRVLIIPREVGMDGALLAERMARHGATTLLATPATFRLLLDAGWQGDPGLTMMSAGETLSPELARRLLPKGRALWNGYGPTETTIVVLQGQVLDPDGPIPLGRPVANTQLYILDAQMRPVAIGEPGELCIGGAGMTRGYLNRPELTAERFVHWEYGGMGVRVTPRSLSSQWARWGLRPPHPHTPILPHSCIGAATSVATCRMAASSTWAGSTTR